MKKLTFDERGYLTPHEPIEVDLETLEKYFVTDFLGSTTRRELFDNYLRFLYRLQDEVFPFFEQWIDGSFVTKKENPGDIDVVTFIDYRVWNTRTEKKMDKFWSFSLEEERIDSYLVKVYPEDHVDYVKYRNDMNYWLRVYGTTEEDEPKGFLKLNLKRYNYG